MESVFTVNTLLETGSSFLGTHFIPIKYHFITKVDENTTQLLCVLYVNLLSKSRYLNTKAKLLKHISVLGDTCHKILPAELLHLRQIRRAGCTG